MAIPPSPPAQQVPRARKVAIVCHQGANEYAPPNTVAAAQLCIDWGMDYVEIDVNMSRDGVLYVFHGPDLAETTDGTGLFHEQSAATLDALDAGSWFDARYRGERVPRLDAYLRWIAGKAKVFFDVKRADLPQLIALVEAVQLEQDSFFWFSEPERALEFRRLAPHLPLKVNAESVAEAVEAHERFGAALVECSMAALSDELLAACHSRGMQVMVFHTDKDPAAFRAILRWDVQLINCDHGDLVARIAAEAGQPGEAPG